MPHTIRSSAPILGTFLLGLSAPNLATPAVAETAITVTPLSMVTELDPDGWTRERADPLPEPEKWNWHVLSERELPAGSPGGVLRPRPVAKAPDASFGNRVDNQDGTAAVTVGRRLPTEWETKVGVDVGLAADPATTYRMNSNASMGNGSAWANLKVPSFATPWSWDQASINARIDPTTEQGQLGTSFSRSVPLGESVSLTLQNGYAVTQSLPAGGEAAPMAAELWSTDRSLKVTLEDSGTSFSARQSLNNVDDKWLRSVSAEQKIFGGPVSLNGTASETISGEIDKSLTATFRKTW